MQGNFLGLTSITNIRPRHSDPDDPADFSINEVNGGLPLWFADQCENTYRAEDRQGNTLFSVVSTRLMNPWPPITSTQVFDRNGVPMYTHGQLVTGLWNGASISAQVPGEPHLHYLFTIAADGKPYAHLIDLSQMGHGSVGEVVAGQANLPLYTTGTLGTAQRGLAVVDDRSGYGPTTLFLLDHQGGQLHLRALSVADLHADPGTPTWHTLESVPATSASTAGRLMPDPDGRRLAYVRAHGPNTGLLQWNNAELRVLHLAPDRLSLTGTPITWTTTNGRVTGLDFSPAGNYLYYTVSGLMYPGTQRLYRKPLTGGAPAAVLNGVTDVRRNAQQGGAHMLGTTATGLVRIAQPDDASPGTSTHPLSGLRQALALQPVIIGPDRSTSTRQLGRRRYELTDHLGNVRVVLGDRKLSDFDPQNTPIPTHFSAEVMAYADYDPFGSLLPGRYAPGDQAGYRFGFQGQEKDDEIHDDPGTSYAFEYRMHDPRVGRFLSIDPLAAKYPHNSTYAFSENRVIDSNELEGLETIPGGQIVTSEDLLAPALLTMATESTITPATLWDTQVRYPTGGPSSEPGLLTEGLIGGVVFTESAIRNGASGFLLLGSALVSGAETFGRHAPIAIANDFSEQRLYPSENYTAPYTLGDNWLPVRRESLAGEKLSPTEGAEIVGAVLGAIGLRYSGFLPTTGSGAADKALEMGVKGGVNAGVTTGMRALDTPPPVVETDEQ